MLDTAPAQRNPGVEDVEQLALAIPKVSEARPLSHSLQRLVHAAEAGKPGARIKQLAHELANQRIGLFALIHCLRDRLRYFKRRLPERRESFVGRCQFLRL